MDMKRTALFFASTAILFSSPHAMAEQPTLNRPFISSNTNVPQMLAQADPAEEEIKQETEQRADDAKQRAADETDATVKSQKNVEKQAKEQADQGSKAAEADANQQAEQAKRKAQTESDNAAEQQKAIEAEAKQKAAEEAKSAKGAEKQAAEDAKQAKRDAQAESDKAAEEQKAVGEAARKKAAAESDAAKATGEETAKEAEKAKKTANQEADKAAEAQKAAEEEARKKADGAQKAADKQTEKAAEEAKQAADKAAKKASDQPVTTEAPAAEKPAEGQPDQATGEKPAAPTKEAQPATPTDATGDKPAKGTATAPTDTPTKPAQQEASPLPENAAPVLDSDKPVKGRDGKNRDRNNAGKKDQATGTAPVEQPAAEAPATPPVAPPKTDADVQQELTPVKIEPVRTEKGTRTKERRRDERPDDVQVIKQFDDRTIVELNNNIFVESSDRPRMSRDAQDVYYEDLPRKRTRETIVRENGVQIITIRNRYGDVIQRSRLMPDGREVMLSYAPDYDREERVEWRDPGDDLPPLRLTIPVREYIMDAEEAPEEEVYQFFAQPPVERVERLYSVDEVKRSARIRDKVRRVDLDTITFPFGSAEIGEDQIARIESVAKAIAQTLAKNPAETFLIEGHTDAVGSDQANLVLSDKRAESVAQALTNVFDIPPENMATQGYGESYLKIKSEGPEQQNRRVAIRRITPLVAPMASSQ